LSLDLFPDALREVDGLRAVEVIVGGDGAALEHFQKLIEFVARKHNLKRSRAIVPNAFRA
jgi:hypothetical protein